ncbi:helix-turn-helix domain-containing protein [Paenibacillus sp. Marseille-Q4541]|uniref:GH39 family glycosyl hydrolase n=1 Tax=Paenibacillus sp. Marseille-Q4541 TaxID=2831522 RepID=UPI001BA9481D|nr:helix-turn-helix domain-containing protein [Paenibacillus sp. Marseille-Q4541]
MDYIYESIQMNSDLPINIFLHNAQFVEDHWHDSIELLFVLKGKVDVYIEKKKCTLQEEDVLIINSNEIHSIQSQENNLLLALQIPISFIKMHFADIEQVRFLCKSFLYGREEQEKFNEIRSLLAEMMWVHNKENYSYELKIKSLLFQLIYVLLWKFRESREDTSSRIGSKYTARLLSIVNYIQDNYMKSLSLIDIAEKEHLSVPYLSSFFQKSMGKSFSQYVNQLRLKHAVRDITYTDHSITQIAMDHGFPSLKSFHKVFKEFYLITPIQYRKGLQRHEEHENLPSNDYATYLDFDRENAYEALFKYLPSPDDQTADKTLDKGVVTKEIRVQLSGKSKAIKPYWRKICTISKAKEILQSEVQSHLKLIQEKAQFSHIRFHGIFDDEMMVYREDAQGNPIFNFLYVGQLIDFIRSIGLRPYIEFGFMPKDLASSEISFFYKKSNLSKPKDLGKWRILVEQWLLFCKNRYGEEEMKLWYFACWNEPDIPIFWPDTFEDYGEIYKQTYQAVKASCPKFHMGGPDLFSETLYQEPWLDQYLDFCITNDCIPDFISFHSYPVRVIEQPLVDKPITWVHLSNDNYLNETIHLLKDKLKAKLSKLPDIHVTEWNSTPFHRDLTNDTCYKAAYIVKNVLENLDEVQSLAYWSLTDLLEELPPVEEPFHGGLGLITSNGIQKPGYYAYELLGKLGDRLLELGDGYCLTQSSQGYQVIVYHYCHFDRLYCMHDSLGIDALNRYHVFRDTNNLVMSFAIQGIPSGMYKLRQTTINRDHGSAYDTWLEMGAPNSLNADEVTYLNRKAVPNQVRKTIDIQNSFDFKCELNPHEVRLYELWPIYEA